MSSSLNIYPEIGEPALVIRKRLLNICNDNCCAAMMLDKFYARAEYAAEYNDYFWQRGDEKQDPCIYRSYDGLATDLFDLFELETVRSSFMLLISKGFVRAWYLGEIGTDLEQSKIKIYCDRGKVEEACKPYYEERQRQLEEETSRQIEREREIAASLPPAPPPPTPEELAQKVLEEKINREAKRVEQQLKRAIKAGVPATLTLEQWLDTLEHFGWKCAYCQRLDFTLLEHFIPLTHEGGTTQSNCVPACHGCNSVKKSWHPSRIPLNAKTSRIQPAIERVRQYLQTLNRGEAAS